jgi:Copper chaperone
MKIIRILFIAVLAISAQAAFSQTTKTDTVKVSGNCGTCKKNIEKAALSAGALKAFWNVDSKVLTVSYDPAKTTNDVIQKKVASVGYDTEKYKGDDDAYNKLNPCCQYDRKKTE